MKFALISCVLLAPVLPVPIAEDPVISPAPPQPCANWIAHEPVLMYEIVGSTLTMDYDRTLTVYADGKVTLADATLGRAGVVIRSEVMPQAVHELQVSLQRAGAQVLCDAQVFATDVPLHTLTMLGGTQDAKAHTFSWWIAEDEYAPIDALLEGFLAEDLGF